MVALEASTDEENIPLDLSSLSIIQEAVPFEPKNTDLVPSNILTLITDSKESNDNDWSFITVKEETQSDSELSSNPSTIACNVTIIKVTIPNQGSHKET